MSLKEYVLQGGPAKIKLIVKMELLCYYLFFHFIQRNQQDSLAATEHALVTAREDSCSAQGATGLLGCCWCFLIPDSY